MCTIFLQTVLCVLCAQNINITVSFGAVQCIKISSRKLNNLAVLISFIFKVASEDRGGRFLPEYSKLPT